MIKAMISIIGDSKKIIKNENQNSLKDFQASANEFFGVFMKVRNGMFSKCVKWALAADIGESSD
jgi:hypothetical protein